MSLKFLESKCKYCDYKYFDIGQYRKHLFEHQVDVSYAILEKLNEIQRMIIK